MQFQYILEEGAEEVEVPGIWMWKQYTFYHTHVAGGTWIS